MRGAFINSAEYTVSSLVAGLTYKFKVEARNSYGYSVYSESVAILCATSPEQPDTPLSEVQDSDVLIQWTAPLENGTPITGYKIYFRQSDDTYSQESTHCSGASTATSCTVPLATLTAAPFLLSLGDNINIKVTAVNAYGDSELSEMGGGAVIQLVPDAPSVIANELSVTSDDKVGLVWTDGSSNGGSSIIDYQVWYD